jgi:hypothetical protein
VMIHRRPGEGHGWIVGYAGAGAVRSMLYRRITESELRKTDAYMSDTADPPKTLKNGCLLMQIGSLTSTKTLLKAEGCCSWLSLWHRSPCVVTDDRRTWTSDRGGRGSCCPGSGAHDGVHTSTSERG